MDGARSNDSAKPQGTQQSWPQSNQNQGESQPSVPQAAPPGGGVANQTAPSALAGPITSTPSVNINSLKSLKELGIDTCFLDVFGEFRSLFHVSPFFYYNYFFFLRKGYSILKKSSELRSCHVFCLRLEKCDLLYRVHLFL